MRAALLLAAFMLSCNSGTPIGQQIDAAIDAPIDAPKLDAPADATPMGTITVTVTVAGHAGSGVTVYFQQADSTLVAEKLTNASGVASVSSTGTPLVTVVAPGSAGQIARLVTFSGAQFGDALTVTVDPPAPAGTTFSLTAPADPGAGGAQLFTTCGESAQPIALGAPASVTLAGCAGSADMIVETFTGSGAPLHWLLAQDVGFGAGSSVALTGAYAAVVADAFAIADAPAFAASTTIAPQLATARGAFPAGVPVGVAGGGATGSATLLVPGAPGAGSALTGAFEVTVHPLAGTIDTQVIASWGALPTGPSSVDLASATLRPWTTAMALDPVVEEVRWSIGSAGATPDYVVTGVSATRAGSAGGTWTWRVAAGATALGAVFYPTLPTDVFDFNFRDTDTTGVFEGEAVAAPGGYDAARPHVFDTVDAVVADPGALGASVGSGTAVTQTR